MTAALDRVAAAPTAAASPGRLLPPATRWWPAFTATYAGQVARARVARVPLLFVATFQSVGILLLLRGVVDDTAQLTRETVVSGCAVLVVAFVALNLLAQRLGAMRASGALDHYATLPVPGSAVLLGVASTYATFAVPGTVATALFGAWLYNLPVGAVWVLVAVVPLAAAALAGLGALVGLLAPRPELATVAGQLGMSLVIFIGVIPAGRLPLPVRWVRDAFPPSYAVDALTGAFHASVDWPGVLVDLLVCAAVGVATLALAALAYARTVRGRGWGRIGG